MTRKRLTGTIRMGPQERDALFETLEAREAMIPGVDLKPGPGGYAGTCTMQLNPSAADALFEALPQGDVKPTIQVNGEPVGTIIGVDYSPNEGADESVAVLLFIDPVPRIKAILFIEELEESGHLDAWVLWAALEDLAILFLMAKIERRWRELDAELAEAKRLVGL